jgi:hypothetical protein
MDNLAFAGIHCNRYKGPNIAGIDPNTGTDQTISSSDRRLEHALRLEWCRDRPLSAIGRVTVSVLFMNDPELLWMRSNLTSDSAQT